MKIIPKSKLDRFVLPGSSKYYKSKKRKRWKIEQTANGSNAFLIMFGGTHVVGRYVRKKDANKSLKRLIEKDSIGYTYELKKIS